MTRIVRFTPLSPLALWLATLTTACLFLQPPAVQAATVGSGTCTKKRLSERWHVLGDGSGVVQRDMYSAFLAAVADRSAIHSSRAHAAWPAAQSLLGRAGWMYPKGHQLVSVASLLATAPEGLGLPTPERVARQRASATGDASDVVVERREPKRVGGDGPRTPWL